MLGAHGFILGPIVRPYSRGTAAVRVSGLGLWDLGLGFRVKGLGPKGLGSRLLKAFRELATSVWLEGPLKPNSEIHRISSTDPLVGILQDS